MRLRDGGGRGGGNTDLGTARAGGIVSHQISKLQRSRFNSLIDVILSSLCLRRAVYPADPPPRSFLKYNFLQGDSEER